MENVSSSNGLEKYPKLRFPGFDEPYRVVTLGEISSMIKRSDPQSNAPVMMLSAGNGFIMQSDKYSRDNAGQSLKKYILLKKGELAYNHGASKAKQFGCCYELQEEEARIPYVYHCFKVCDTEYTPYVALELNNPKMDKQLKRLVSSSVRMDGLLNISYEEYMSVQVYLPAYSEQKRIADFIEKLDERIAKQEQLIEALKKYKRGLLSHLFSEKSTQRCTTKRYYFSEIAQRRSEKYDPSSGIEYPCVELENIEQESGKILATVPSIKQGSIKNIARPGDTLFGKLRPYLRKYAFAEQMMVCSSEIWTLIPSDVVLPKFLFYLTQTEQFLQVANISSGTKMPRAEWSNIEKAEFFIPDFSVQHKAVSLLERVDKKITYTDSVLIYLKGLKTGLMQKLFI
ncbi:restriction endonuclease subunit S [Dorea formicigenerans]|uniref:Restriction endonuclease subunit S n=2 Tax=Lachnospiraceae TaxID=186803 RepID=A0A3E5GVW1_9FIRM|nr:restriction endonuclease subunit S [Dorea formicigenerans]RGO54075.1 restriction endonuclease subunit S [Dorea formicigenerans]